MAAARGLSVPTGLSALSLQPQHLARLPNGSLATNPPETIVLSDLQRIQFGQAGQTYTQEPNQLNPADCP